LAMSAESFRRNPAGVVTRLSTASAGGSQEPARRSPTVASRHREPRQALVPLGLLDLVLTRVLAATSSSGILRVLVRTRARS
jgi:hypothetical protein